MAIFIIFFALVFLLVLALIFFTLLVIIFILLSLHSSHILLLAHLILMLFLNSLIVFLRLILVILILLVHLHILIGVLLCLEHQKLLLLGFIEDIDASILTYRWRNATWEVCKLVKLIEVLSSLEENLLVLSQVIIWVKISVSENSNVLLKVTNLIIKVNEFLGLLLN